MSYSPPSPPSYSSNHDYSESLFPISNPTPQAITSSRSYEFRLMDTKPRPRPVDRIKTTRGTTRQNKL